VLLQERRAGKRRRVVDEHVDAALAESGDHAIERGTVEEIRPHPFGVDAERATVLERLLEIALRAIVVEEAIRAFTGELERDRAADSPRRPRDERPTPR
jgi:hypothetical protein